MTEIHCPPQSHATFLIQYNKKSILVMTVSLLGLTVLLPPSTWLASTVNLSRACLYAFEGMLLFILQCRFMRRKDKRLVKEFPLTFSTAVAATTLILIVSRGDTSYFSMPLVALMFILSSFSQWFYEQNPRPNILGYFASCVPTALVCTIGEFLPSYAVAVPGIALSGAPLLYSVWCGVGYPFLSLLFRIFCMNYFSNYIHNLVKQERMAPSGVVPYLSTVSFIVGTSLMFGNNVLLYLSSSVGYAASASAFAILTEIAGKLYSVYIIRNKTKLHRELLKQASKLTKNASRVGSMTTGEGTVSEDVDDAESEAAAVSEDNKKQEQQMLMFAVRLLNEIIA
jgi:hypothetical protein